MSLTSLKKLHYLGWSKMRMNWIHLGWNMKNQNSLDWLMVFHMSLLTLKKLNYLDLNMMMMKRSLIHLD